MSRDKAPVKAEMSEKTEPLRLEPEEFIKRPYVLEFIKVDDRASFHESDLEQAIIDKLQSFLLELGKGFAFVARQYRVLTESKVPALDLVFYNYILKCFVLFDLKVDELAYGDIGQMDFYVRAFEDKMRGEGDGPTVGIILCSWADETIVKYSILNESRQLFATRYRLVLPSEDELRAEVTRERALVVREARATYHTRQNGLQRNS